MGEKKSVDERNVKVMLFSIKNRVLFFSKKRKVQIKSKFIFYIHVSCARMRWQNVNYCKILQKKKKAQIVGVCVRHNYFVKVEEMKRKMVAVLFRRISFLCGFYQCIRIMTNFNKYAHIFKM